MHTLHTFLAFARRQPPEATYDSDNPRTCAIGQYAAAHGYERILGNGSSTWDYFHKSDPQVWFNLGNGGRWAAHAHGADFGLETWAACVARLERWLAGAVIFNRTKARFEEI